ncbi:MAG TPA: hypothetical protein VF173_14785 [Thermoanaerobaculia bacterium]|nr:hypothetical protein [Thermoanaerobaculia bacterium]
MTRNRLRRRLAAVALGLLFLVPAVAMAQTARPAVPASEGRGVLATLWSFVSGLIPRLHAVTGTATADPDGEHRGQMDPDGLTVTGDPGGENRGQMDPNG